jgi:hypothetical protein
MTSPLSTDDGDDGNDFDSLEERIVYTERDKEREVRTSVRLNKIHLSQMDQIQVNLGTNKVEIMNRAYSAGLSKLREINFVERSDSLLDMTNKVNEFLASDREYWSKAGLDSVRYDGYEIEVGNSCPSDLQEPMALLVKDSVLSEVNTRIMDSMVIKGGVHRGILTIGLSTSENCYGTLAEFAEENIENFDNALTQSRCEAEEQFTSALTRLGPHIVEEGVEEEKLELLREVRELMQTDMEWQMTKWIEAIEEDADVR